MRERENSSWTICRKYVVGTTRQLGAPVGAPVESYAIRFFISDQLFYGLWEDRDQCTNEIYRKHHRNNTQTATRQQGIEALRGSKYLLSHWFTGSKHDRCYVNNTRPLHCNNALYSQHTSTGIGRRFQIRDDLLPPLFNKADAN